MRILALSNLDSTSTTPPSNNVIIFVSKKNMNTKKENGYMIRIIGSKHTFFIKNYLVNDNVVCVYLKLGKFLN